MLTKISSFLVDIANRLETTELNSIVGSSEAPAMSRKSSDRIVKNINEIELFSGEYYGFFNPSTGQVIFTGHENPLFGKPKGNWHSWHSHQKGEKGDPSLIDLFDCFFNKDQDWKYILGSDGLTSYRMTDRGRVAEAWRVISAEIKVRNMRELMAFYAKNPGKLNRIKDKILADPNTYGFEINKKVSVKGKPRH